MATEWVTVCRGGGKSRAKSKKKKESRPRELLRSTDGKENFQRFTRLLISGGTALLKEKLDQSCPPSDLLKKLADQRTKDQLWEILTKPQWHCLYPSSSTYVKPEKFDISLTFHLLITIAGIPAPVRGWNNLPSSTDVSLGADIARIKYYRNEVFAHVNQEMSLCEDDFARYWDEMKKSLLRIARTISPEKEHEWKEEIEKFLNEPLTENEKRCEKELKRWVENDVEKEKSLERLDPRFQTVKQSVNTIREEMEKIEETVKECTKSKVSAESECSQEVRKGVAELDMHHSWLGREGSPEEKKLFLRSANSYLDKVNPSTHAEFDKYLNYLERVRQLIFRGVKEGSLIITVGCRSVQILEGLWIDYREGHLNEMAQKYLVTDEILHEFGVSEIKLTTNISEEEYRRCRQELLLYSELEQKLTVVKDLRDVLQEKFLAWARMRESNVTLLREFLTQLRGFAPGRAGATGAILGGVFAVLTPVPLLFGATAAGVVGATGAVLNKWDMQRKAKDEIIKERKVFDELQLKADSLKKPLAGLADFCQKHTDSVLSSRHLEGEFHLLSRTLQKQEREDPDGTECRTLPDFIKEEVEVHYTSIRRPLELLSTSPTDEEIAEKISRILNELKVGPGVEEIRAMISNFIEQEFAANFTSRDG